MVLTQTGETIHAVHDLDGNRLAEYDYDASTGSSTLIRQYVWMEGRVVAVVEGGQVFFLRTDHIGRPVFATNELGGARSGKRTTCPSAGCISTRSTTWMATGSRNISTIL